MTSVAPPQPSDGRPGAAPAGPGPTTPRPRSPRLDPDTRGGLRLTLTAVAALLAAVPFGLLLVLVADGWAPLRRLDLRVAEGLHGTALAHPGYVTVLKVLSDAGSPTTFRVVAVVVAAVLLIRRRPRLAVWLLVTVEAGGLVDTLVKDVVRRARPSFPHPVATAVSTSFPSGHAFGVVVAAGALLLVALPALARPGRIAAALVAALVVLTVGWTRLALGVHFVSDVVGGYVLGAAWLAATTAAFRAWHRDRLQPAGGQRPVTEGLEPDAPEDAPRTVPQDPEV